MPSDGLPVFVEQTWGVIRTQKELNLPGQREMVANFRCNEMKEEAMQKVKERLVSLEARCVEALIENFGASCSELMDEAMDHYSQSAKQYNQEVSNKIKGELEEQLISQLYQCFDSQLKLHRQRTFKVVESDVRKLEKKPLEEVADHCSRILEKLIQENMKRFEQKSSNLVLENTDWGG